MATHKDAIKRARQALENRDRNRARRTRMKNLIKKLRANIEAGEYAEANATLPQVVSIIQKTAQKGVIHKSNAARRVKRLTKAVNDIKPAE